MTAKWVAALDTNGAVRWFDFELVQVGVADVEGAIGPLYGDGKGQEVCLRGASGIVCSAGPGTEFETRLEVAGAVGRGAVCPDGFAVAITADALYVPKGNPTSSFAFPIGELSPDLGPIVHRPTGTVAVPIDGGTAVRVLLPYGNIYDLTTRREFDVSKEELPGGILGMAFGEQELFVAARDARLVAVRLDAVPDSTDHNWAAQAKEQDAWASGPVVTALGDVLVLGSDAHLLHINQANKANPARWGSAIPFTDLHAIPGGGVSGLGTVQLLAQAPAELFPWLSTEAKNPFVGYPLTGCQAPMRLFLGGENGRALVTCKNALRLVVPPAPTDSGSQWPTAHGPDGSGCFMGDATAPPG